MRVYESAINEDEVIDDAYPSTPNAEVGTLMFEGRYVEKRMDDDDPSSVQTVCDIVDNFNLQSYDLKRSAFVGWAKKFMPMRKKQLETSNPTKVDQFMADAKKYVAYVTAHFDQFEFYLLRSCDPDDYLFAATQDGEKTVFHLLELACNNVKC
jgi:hypothetical protein